MGVGKECGETRGGPGRRRKREGVGGRHGWRHAKRGTGVGGEVEGATGTAGGRRGGEREGVGASDRGWGGVGRDVEGEERDGVEEERTRAYSELAAPRPCSDREAGPIPKPTKRSREAREDRGEIFLQKHL